MVVERVSFSAADTIAVWHTASPREDAGTTSGWSIGDRGHTDTGHTGASSWSDGGPPFLIKVMGEVPAEFLDRVLISNTGQTLHSSSNFNTVTTQYGARFQTGGSHLGYRLSSIGFAFGAISDTSTAGSNLRVTLRGAEGFPSHTICTLSPPASFRANAVNRFGASTCPALAPNTRYYTVIEHLDPDSNEIAVSSTKSTGKEPGAAAGWDIIRSTFLFGFAGGLGTFRWDQSDLDSTWMFELRGRALLPAEQPERPAPPAQHRKQVANTGQTGLVGSALTSTRTRQAQAFTTGSHSSGYWLHSVRMGFRTVTAPSPARLEIRVTLHEGGGDDPGEELCLIESGIRALPMNGVASMDSYRDCPTLKPNTTYFLVIERDTITSGNTIEVSVTPRDGEDSARPGWSIADDSRVYDGTAWASGGGSSMAIDVRAVDLPAEQPENLGPVQDLVSNTGQSLDQPESLSGNLTKAAQKFTAGDNPGGYRLRSLGIHFNHVSWLALSATTVTLNADANGEPGAALCTLVPPGGLTSDVSNAVLTYTAPASGAEACSRLAAGATYFVVVEQDVAVAVADISRTESDAEDSGAAPGWSIANAIHSFNASTSVWIESPGASYLIKISGAAVLSDPSALGPAPQPRRFIYTVAAGDESTVEGVAVGGPGTTDDLDLSGGAITVVATGADAPLDYTPLPQDGDHLVNWARPALVRAGTSRDGSLVRLTFSEELETVGGAPTSRFTVKVDGEAVELTGIDVVAPIDAPVDTGSGTGGDDPPPAEEPWTVDAPREVPADWALTPEGLGAGDEFRLLFLTSTTRDATSSATSTTTTPSCRPQRRPGTPPSRTTATASTPWPPRPTTTPGTTRRLPTPPATRACPSTGWAATSWPTTTRTFTTAPGTTSWP